MKVFGRIYELGLDQVGSNDHQDRFSLLPETTLEMAHVLAEKTPSSMEQIGFNFEEQKTVVTVRAGVSEYQAEEHLDDLLRKADNALFESKRLVRNRISDDVQAL